MAAVFTAINFVGAVFAAVAQEPIHAGVHVLLGVVGLYLTWRASPWRIVDRTSQLDSSAAGDLPPEQIDRLSQLEQSVDAVAIEVERIGESQRFMTKVLAEQEQPQSKGDVPPSTGKPPAR